MGFSDFSRSSYQLKSMSLRSNENFVRLYDAVAEVNRLEVLFPHVWVRLESHWVRFQDTVKDIEQLLKRAEKNTQLSKVLAGIMLQFEQKIFPHLENFQLRYGSGSGHLSLLVSSGFVTDAMVDEKFLLRELLEDFAECLSSGLESAHKLSLLSFVYRYLIGCVDKGGGKTYSPGSFLFRLIFVAIVLFLGSYVWIKSRHASFTASRRKRKSWPLADRASQLGDESEVPGGVYRRAVRDTRGSVTHYKYEPRFKPRREKPESGTTLKFNYLPLGSYDTRREAEIMRHIAAVLYGKEEVRPVQFEDGLCLPFPSVTGSENCPPSGKEKAVWVTDKTKQLYAELLEEKARRLQLPLPVVETGPHHGHGGEASRSDPSASAPGAPSTAIEMTCFTSPHGGNGLVEQPITSESHGLGREPALAREVLLASESDCDFRQFISSMFPAEENDSPAMDSPAMEKIKGDYPATDCASGFEATSVPAQSSALDIPISAFSARQPQLGGGDQGLEIIEPHLNSATAIPFPQLQSLPEQVQLQVRVTCQEQRPEEFSGSNVELQQKLLESKERISELEQKLRQSEVENEKWRSMFRQLAKLI